MTEFASVFQKTNCLKYTTFKRILEVTNGIAELSTAIIPLINEPSKSANILNKIAKEMNGCKDRKYSARETVLRAVSRIGDIIEIITREFESIDGKKLAQMKEITKGLAQDLNHQNCVDSVKQTSILQAASCTARLAQIMWYQLHMTTATRINSCSSTDYARILNIEKSDKNPKAADDAFEKLSDLFDPHATLGNQYYEGALSAAARKFICAIFQLGLLNPLI